MLRILGYRGAAASLFREAVDGEQQWWRFEVDEAVRDVTYWRGICDKIRINGRRSTGASGKEEPAHNNNCIATDDSRLN
jgi:hypothetical protein